MEAKNNFNKANSDLNGWNRNTDFSCDVKTILRSDKRALVGKEYRGVLRLDREALVEDFLSRDPHYTFVETVSSVTTRRHPRVFDGNVITVTRWSDGSLHPNFKPMRVDGSFSVDGYAIAVCNELRKALTGLVEK